MSWFGNNDLVRMIAEQNAALIKQDHEWLQRSIERLTKQILEMQKQGFVHEPTIVQERMTPDIPEVVATAIAAAARPGSALSGELTEWALAMLGNDVDPEHVADHLMRGSTDA